MKESEEKEGEGISEYISKDILREKKIINEMIFLSDKLKKVERLEEKRIILSQMISLKNSLKEVVENASKTLEAISLPRPLYSEAKAREETKETTFEEPVKPKKPVKKTGLSQIEKDTLRRLKKERGKIIAYRKIKTASTYVNVANKLFSNFSHYLLKRGMFNSLGRDLIRSNLQYVPANYISVVLFTTLISIIFSILLFLFLLAFEVGPTMPFIKVVEGGVGKRILQIIWILFAIPLATYLITYFYPSMERRSIEKRINNELPFATIHMSAISNSMLEPSKLFEIIVSTKEYPYIEKEFIKLINEINIYGYDLTSALRNIAYNSPSEKLKELFNGLATTINSGGSLTDFFEERAKSMLFDYRIEKEKRARSAETFMDIYISVVIAAPMILMLLLIMIKISGVGLAVSTSMLTLIMVLGVSMINIAFLVFLHIKQAGTE